MKAYLIGAGPGDPGLFTLRGKAVLEKADVVVYDYLANHAFLQWARPDAELIYVGKKAGAHALPQREINSLLVRKAKEGKLVARLKGGDPYIFGRGGEEAEALADAGIEFETVPGISSAAAAPAYAGIPLTHRAFASSVTLITGHEDPDKPGSAHNWKALAAGAGTLVFVMGMKTLPEISRKLIEAGLPPDTPAALIHWGTTPRQRSLVSTLDKLPHEAVAQGFANPSLIVVGGVVSLRDRLNWFEKKPLLGRGVVVTRAEEQAGGLANMLEELGAEAIRFPTISIVPLEEYGKADALVEQLASYDWLIFTSVNGVRHFWRRLAARGKDSRALGRCKAAAIGPATADALRARGVEPDFVPEKYLAEGIVEGLLALGAAGKRVLVPRALEAREVLPDELRKAGAEVDILPVYRTLPARSRCGEVLELLDQGRIHCVTFGSSSTADNFLSLIPPDTLRKYPLLRLAAIGPITKKTLERHGLECHIMPEEHTIPALVASLREAL